MAADFIGGGMSDNDAPFRQRSSSELFLNHEVVSRYSTPSPGVWDELRLDMSERYHARPVSATGGVYDFGTFHQRHARDPGRYRGLVSKPDSEPEYESDDEMPREHIPRVKEGLDDLPHVPSFNDYYTGTAVSTMSWLELQDGIARRRQMRREEEEERKSQRALLSASVDSGLGREAFATTALVLGSPAMTQLSEWLDDRAVHRETSPGTVENLRTWRPRAE